MAVKIKERNGSGSCSSIIEDHSIPTRERLSYAEPLPLSTAAPGSSRLWTRCIHWVPTNTRRDEAYRKLLED